MEATAHSLRLRTTRWAMSDPPRSTSGQHLVKQRERAAYAEQKNHDGCHDDGDRRPCRDRIKPLAHLSPQKIEATMTQKQSRPSKSTVLSSSRIK